jgi:hypothetical protein
VRKAISEVQKGRVATTKEKEIQKSEEKLTRGLVVSPAVTRSSSARNLYFLLIARPTREARLRCLP